MGRATFAYTAKGLRSVSAPFRNQGNLSMKYGFVNTLPKNIFNFPSTLLKIFSKFSTYSVMQVRIYSKI